MYYFVSNEDWTILDCQENKLSTKDVQKMANYHDTELYVIDGERIGMSASPRSSQTPPVDILKEYQ